MKHIILLSVCLFLISGCQQVADDFADSFGEVVVPGDEAENDQTFPLLTMTVSPPEIETDISVTVADDSRSQEEILLPTEGLVYSYSDKVLVNIQGVHPQGIKELGVDVNATWSCYSPIAAELQNLACAASRMHELDCISRGYPASECRRPNTCVNQHPENFWSITYSHILISNGQTATTTPWALFFATADASNLGFVGGSDIDSVYYVEPSDEGIRCPASRHVLANSIISIRAKATSYANKKSITPWFRSKFQILREDLYQR